MQEVDRKRMLTQPGEDLGRCVFCEIGDGESPYIVFIEDVPESNAYEAYADPGNDGKVVDGMVCDVWLMETQGELENVRGCDRVEVRDDGPEDDDEGSIDDIGGFESEKDGTKEY
jgi:hypothetical protein